MTSVRDLTQISVLHNMPSTYYAAIAEVIKRESILDSTREELLWRWEVKKVSCLAEHKPLALAMRSWMKQVCKCTSSSSQNSLVGNTGRIFA